jgi:hypothetical protein
MPAIHKTGVIHKRSGVFSAIGLIHFCALSILGKG